MVFQSQENFWPHGESVMLKQLLESCTYIYFFNISTAGRSIEVSEPYRLVIDDFIHRLWSHVVLISGALSSYPRGRAVKVALIRCDVFGPGC